jgi:hypothetical protein
LGDARRSLCTKIIDPISILSIGEQLGLSQTELRAALETARCLEKVQRDFISGDAQRHQWHSKILH